MIQRFRLILLLALVVFICLPAPASAQPALREERIAASFVLALGRTPTATEVSAWLAQEPGSVADLVARHRRQLQSDSAAQRAVIAKASLDAVGLAPADAQAGSLSGGVVYADLMQSHLQGLAARPADYEQVMHRAYRWLLKRDAYSVEIEYWKKQPVLSFALLVGCIDDWARRNQPGLMFTTGVASVSVNSGHLATVRLSPAVAAETRVASGLPQAADAALAHALGRALVAPGAAEVASVGGIPFTAAGAPSLASALRNPQAP